MNTEYAVITLPGKGNYAVTLPGQITFLLDATPEELKTELAQILNEYIPEENSIFEARVSLAIIPTFDCNLRCIYCYAKGGESQEIVKLEYVKKTLEYKQSLFPNTKWLDLYLVGGGEPLLYFNFVKDIHQLSQDYFKNVQVHVVTNGTFNNDVANWLIEVDADVRISYDGVAQSYQRPYANGKTSTQKVERTIKRLAKVGLNPIVQMIITSESVNSMINSAIRTTQMGVKVIKVEPALSSEVSRGKQSIEPNPVLYAKKLLELIQYIANNKLPLQVDTGFFTKPASGFYCGMANGNFTLTPEGLITPCVEVARSHDPFMDRIRLGSVINGSLVLDTSNISFLKTLHYTNQEGGCRSCPYRMICLGGCPMANIWRNGLPLKKSAYTCSIEHALLPNLLLIMAENPIIMDIVMENIVLV
jgi:uncharacterized protein